MLQSLRLPHSVSIVSYDSSAIFAIVYSPSVKWVPEISNCTHIMSRVPDLSVGSVELSVYQAYQSAKCARISSVSVHNNRYNVWKLAVLADFQEFAVSKFGRKTKSRSDKMLSLRRFHCSLSCRIVNIHGNLYKYVTKNGIFSYILRDEYSRVSAPFGDGGDDHVRCGGGAD